MAVVTNAKRFLQRLPPPLQAPLRACVDWLRYPPFSAERRRRQWVQRVYTPFGRQQRLDLMLDIARFAVINRPIDGYYFEFGSHEANTMRMAWQSFGRLFDWHFVSFDSFQGLPAIEEIDEQQIWEKGKLRTEEESFLRLVTRAGMPRSRLSTVPGFYDATLTPDLAARLLPRKAAVVYIDCDLYHSTVPILAWIPPFLQPGTVVVFDDWNCFRADPDKGERRAWREFCDANPRLHFEPFVQTGMQASFVFVGEKD
jgi:O-methyltransferase